jgi:hypothetical protein
MVLAVDRKIAAAAAAGISVFERIQAVGPIHILYLCHHGYSIHKTSGQELG